MENNQFKILLVDDETDILEFLSFNLTKEGYHVKACDNGEQAIKLAKEFKPNLIILDVMMPGMDGIETCKEIRHSLGENDTLIVFLTARGEDYSQIAGLDAGADDYIPKPIKPRVFLSRVKALLRRYSRANNKPSETEDLIKIGDLLIDRYAYIIKTPDGKLQLPKKEFELLTMLARKPGKVFTRDQILNSIWGNEVIVGDRTIDVHIRKLRQKVGDKYIKTVKGVGYKFDY